MDLEKIVLQEIVAFLPIYIDMKGNCTLLHDKQGESYEIEKTTKTILNQLSNFYLINLKATRKHYGDLLSIKNLVPIPFNEDNVFIPVKSRKPICKNDGSVGYVNINYINKTVKSKDGTIIYLKNNNTINSLNSIETVNKHIKNGHVVKKLWKEKQSSTLINEYDFYEDYELPATKGDIAILRREIIAIKETMK